MEPLLDFGLEATRWLQDAYPQLEGFFRTITELGREEFYLALLPLIYWCWNKQWGGNLAFVFMFSAATNSLFKHAFRGPRPYWIESDVGLAEAFDYGVPSGHTQFAATLYFFIAAWIKRGWVWILALLMVVAMGLSRIYLGVHFVHDVVVGFLLALLVLLGYALWRRYLRADFSKRILGQRLLGTVAVALVLSLIYALVRLIIGEPDSSVQWAAFIPQAELEGIEGMASAVGALLGVGIGLNLEVSRCRFLVAGPIWKLVVRYVLGLVVTVIIWGGLKVIFPEDPLGLAIPLRILRYFLATLWVTYYGPVLFVRLGLADAEPQPELSMKL
jgi:membrane-associated phospholipid phosphatase